MAEPNQTNSALDLQAKRDIVTAINGLISAISAAAPRDAQYLVATANTELSAERVATNSASVTWDFSVSGEAIANVVAATQTQMEAASSAVVSVVPAVQQFHPGHPKAWAMVTVSGGTPTLQTSYNVTSITDTATGRLTITIATDFSSVNYCNQISVEAASNATAVANRRFPCIANGGIAAGTVELNCWDGTAVNSNLVDPASWHWMALGDQ